MASGGAELDDDTRSGCKFARQRRMSSACGIRACSLIGRGFCLGLRVSTGRGQICPISRVQLPHELVRPHAASRGRRPTSELLRLENAGDARCKPHEHARASVASVGLPEPISGAAACLRALQPSRQLVGQRGAPLPTLVALGRVREAARSFCSELGQITRSAASTRGAALA